MPTFQKIGLTCKPQVTLEPSLVPRIVQFFAERGRMVDLDPKLRPYFDPPCAGCEIRNDAELDLLIVLGGDGTILRAVRDRVHQVRTFLGVNTGHLGFLTQISAGDLMAGMEQIVRGDVRLDTRTMLQVRDPTGDGAGVSRLALNEVAFHPLHPVRTVQVTVLIDGHELARYHGDGLIVSTPTGSTAYNRSAGGPILHPAVPALILTPLNASSFAQKPIVIPSQARVHVSAARSREPVFYSIDGDVIGQLGDATQTAVEVVTASTTVTFVHLPAENYYSKLKEKLEWGRTLVE